LEPFWQDEKDWLCTVEFCPLMVQRLGLFASDIIGHLFGYAHLTNTRSPFRRLKRKTSFWN
jgi:hypothetical protein